VQRVEIPRKDYSDLDEVASEIQTALRSASPNNVQYKVLYDDASGFIIKGNDPGIKNYELLWNSGPGAESSAAETLGFDSTRDDLVAFADSDQAVVNLFIDSSNNKIDFREVISGNTGMVTANLTASITPKTYTSHVELGREVEKALEAESLKNGNRVDYSVSWDEQTRQFSIKENGTRLEEFHLLWQTGENAPPSEGGTGEGIGSILGFSPVDDIAAPVSSTAPVEWGIFDTLLDLSGYLESNDTDGIERTLGRLETHFDQMTSRIADTGIRYNRLEVRNQITTEVSLSLEARRSTIEDADIIESIMNLQSIENAYQASLSSTAKLMNISLVDYL
jgi:flagellar hook-associated protein 3 FlgL